MNATDCIDRISAAVADHEGGGSGEDECLAIIGNVIGEFMNAHCPHYHSSSWPLPDYTLVRQAVARSHGTPRR